MDAAPDPAALRPETFLESDAALALLERAGTVAGTAVSLHDWDVSGEGDRVWGCGGCAACALVHDLQWGAQYCRRSRAKASASARLRGRAVPFLCHMQFPCVAVPALAECDESPVLTFGPYCPDTAPGSLEGEAREGLARIDGREATAPLPVSLDDIPVMSSDAVRAVATWTAESLTALYRSATAPTRSEADATIDAVSERRYRSHHPRAVRDAYQGTDILAALVAGDAARARVLIRTAIGDGDATSRNDLGVMRARALAMVGSVIEAAERAGHDAAPAWDATATLAEALVDAKNLDEIGAEARRVLRAFRRNGGDLGGKDFAPVYRAIVENIEAGITLGGVAALVGETPSAIAKRLQRKLGMSFSEYKGRVRVDKAKDLLTRTKLSMGEVARRVGMADASNFAKLFRRHEGTSPTTYRRKHGKR